ncbi:MAG: protein kinase [Proteobacteria bacterium]|nr:protein kinase [Pseudomonadota bacterium]
MDNTKKTRFGTPPVNSALPDQGRGAVPQATPVDDGTGPTLAQFSTEMPLNTPAPMEAIQAAAATPHELGPNLPAAGQPVYTSPPDPYIGRTIADRYHVHNKLGEGGMGSVYLAQHITLEKQVALKILHRELARKADLVQRFLQEAKAASRIRHENVIDITDFGITPEGAVFFAMEVLEGRDLHDLIARAKYEDRIIPWQRSRSIFLQICAALSAAHHKGVIHRDLKPENIYLVEWLGHRDFVKLLDFGIAKLTEVSDQDRKLTRTGMLFGTPEYMSPEQARGDKVDERVDIYAMGCILYQLITGSVPFTADNFMGILSQHLTVPPPVIPDDRLAAVQAPPGINQVIGKALAKEREHRFASVDDMVSAIHALEEGEDGGGQVVPVVQAPSDGMRKRTEWTGRVAMPDTDIGSGKPAPPAAPRKTGLWIAAGLIGAAAMLAIAFVAMEQGQGQNAVQPVTEQEQTPAQTGVNTAAGPGDDAPVKPSSEPPEPTVATTARVSVIIRSEPSGANVIDEQGEVVGVTPLDLTMPVSRQARRFRLQLRGFEDNVVEFAADRDIDTSVTFDKVKSASPVPSPPVLSESTERQSSAPARVDSKAKKPRSRTTRGSTVRQSRKSDKRPRAKPPGEPDPSSDPQLKNPFQK